MSEEPPKKDPKPPGPGQASAGPAGAAMVPAPLNNDLALTEPPPVRRRRLIRLLAVLALIAAAGGVWAWSPLGEYTSTTAVLDLLGALRHSYWAPLILIGGLVAAGFAMFPISVLVSLSGVLFGPLWGFIYAMVGSLLSAGILFFIGRRMGPETAERIGGRAAHSLAKKLARHGFISMTLLAMMPVAPFTIYNLAAGMSRIRLRHFVAGTVVGMSPAMLALVIFGESLERLVLEADLRSIVVALGSVALVGVIGFAANAWYVRRRRQRRAQQDGLGPDALPPGRSASREPGDGRG